MTENNTAHTDAEFDAKLKALTKKHALEGYAMSAALAELMDGDVQKTARAIAAHGMANLCAFLESAKKEDAVMEDGEILEYAMTVFGLVKKDFVAQALREKFGMPKNAHVIIIN